MQESQEFRCPFEVSGQRTGTIIEVMLGEERTARLQAIRTAYDQLFAGLDNSAVRLVLPGSLRAACSSNEELQPLLLPYQTEALAVHLDMALWPYLFYQRIQRGQGRGVTKVPRDSRKIVMAAALDQTVDMGRLPPLGGMHDLARWIEEGITIARKVTPRNPGFAIETRKSWGRRALTALTIEEGAISYSLLDPTRLKDRAYNKQIFSVVKTPFYPRAFGRWSENIEIVITRDVDFLLLPEGIRQEIRRRANTVYAAHGVRIDDLDNTMLQAGLWIPKYT